MRRRRKIFQIDKSFHGDGFLEGKGAKSESASARGMCVNSGEVEHGLE